MSRLPQNSETKNDPAEIVFGISTGGELQPWNLAQEIPANTSDVIGDLIHESAENGRDKINECEKAEVRCGLIGPSGTGKFSLINAIAAVGVVETTVGPPGFYAQGNSIHGLPGLRDADLVQRFLRSESEAF